MPLTTKGEKIKRNMEKEYGKDKGEEVFYASQNKGTIKGTHKKGDTMDKFAEGFMERMGMLGVPQAQAEAMLKVAIFSDRLESSPDFATGATAILKDAQWSKLWAGIANKVIPAARKVQQGYAKHRIGYNRAAVGTAATGAGIAAARGLGIGDKTTPPKPPPPAIREEAQGAWNTLPGWGKGLVIGVPAVALGAMLDHAIAKKHKTPEDEAEEGV